MRVFAVEEHIFSSEQPTSDDLKAITKLDGIKSLVNLRQSHEEGQLEAVEPLARSLGLSYHHFPISGEIDINQSRAEALNQLLKTISPPVLIYCRSANRVGALLALLGYYCRQMEPAEALAYGRSGGLQGLEAHVINLLGISD